MRLILSLLLLSVLFGCGSNQQATRAVVNMEVAAISYSKNMNKIVDAFISDYRWTALEKVNADTDAALASVTDAQGKIDVRTAKALQARKLTLITAVERKVLLMRRKPLAAFKDIEHLMKYSEALQEYFNQKAQTAVILEQSTEQMLTMLERILGADETGKGEAVP